MPKYTHRNKCNHCHCYLSENQRAYSHGVCPNCGHDSDSTFVDTYKEIGYWKVSPGITFWAWLFGTEDRIWVPTPKDQYRDIPLTKVDYHS